MSWVSNRDLRSPNFGFCNEPVVRPRLQSNFTFLNLLQLLRPTRYLGINGPDEMLVEKKHTKNQKKSDSSCNVLVIWKMEFFHWNSLEVHHQNWNACEAFLQKTLSAVRSQSFSFELSKALIARNSLLSQQFEKKTHSSLHQTLPLEIYLTTC